MRKRHPLARRFRAALGEPADDRLRALDARRGLSDNHLLMVLLERLDDYAQPTGPDAAFAGFVAEYGAPPPEGRE